VTVNVVNVPPGTGTDVFGISEVNFPTPPPPFPIVDTHFVDSAAFSLVGGDMLSNAKLPTSPDFATQATSAFVALHRVDVEAPDSKRFFPGEFAVVSSPVPEPSTDVVMVVGLLAALLVRARNVSPHRPLNRDRRRDW
jgi:PEP-CTERM motif-containing protein